MALKVGCPYHGTYIGGVERWQQSLARHSRHEWSVYNLGYGQKLDGDLTGERDIPGLRTHREGYREWRDQQDCLMLWMCWVRDLIDGFTGPIVAVNHSGHPDVAKIIDRPERLEVSHYVGVSELSTSFCPQPALTIRHGVDPEFIKSSLSRSEARAWLGLSDDQVALMYSGRWSNEKRPLAIAEAASLISSSVAVACVPNCLNHRENAERALAGALGDKARWRVVEDRVADCMRACDVLVMASRHEGGPLSVIEGWAAGIAVASTVTGVINEVERENGRTVARIPDNPNAEQLAAGVREALACKDELIEAGKRYSESWSAVDMAARWDDFLETCVAERKGGVLVA